MKQDQYRPKTPKRLTKQQRLEMESVNAPTAMQALLDAAMEEAGRPMSGGGHVFANLGEIVFLAMIQAKYEKKHILAAIFERAFNVCRVCAVKEVRTGDGKLVQRIFLLHHPEKDVHKQVEAEVKKRSKRRKAK